ncbi:MAG: Kelch repeat-containing protein [Limisphaerales bacterium]
MPEAVTSFGAACLDGWLYVLGGHKGERHEYSAPMVSGAFHRLKLSDGKSWETLPSAEPGQGLAIAGHGGSVYRVGGMAARNQPGEKSDLHSKDLVARYDVRAGSWESVAPLPEPRSSHDAVVLGDSLYVGGGWTLAGGSSKGVWCDHLLQLDLKAGASEWKAVPQPFRRRAIAMAGSGTRLYFLGGIDAEGKTSSEVDIFEVDTGVWSKGPDLPPGPMKGFGCSAIAQAGAIYSSGMKGELWRLEPDGTAWTVVGKLANPRFFHRLAPAGTGHLVVAGGEDSEGKLNSLEVFDLAGLAKAKEGGRP